jgi:hypothetical protein
MSRSHFWLRLSLFVAIFSPRPARASELFPITIQANLALGSAPPCVLCHDTELGGSDSANQPVGRKMSSYGLMGGDTGMLATILGQMRDAKDDSDRDGTSDVDELKAGTDPNINDITGEPPADYAPPVYGCHASGGHAATLHLHGNCAAVAAELMAFIWLRSRMQQRRAIRVRRRKDV